MKQNAIATVYRIGVGFNVTGSKRKRVEPFSGEHFRKVVSVSIMMRQADLDGAVSPSIGSTGVWGVEAGASIEIATVDHGRVEALIRRLLVDLKQDAVYVSTDGVDPVLYSLIPETGVFQVIPV
jgi:hypothetical protein